MDKLIKDFKFMLGRELGFYWKFCWFYFIPLTIICLFFYSLISYDPVKYANIALPLGAQLFGWSIFSLGVFLLLAIMVAQFMHQHVNYKQRLSDSDDTSLTGWCQLKDRVVAALFRPMDSWGPSSYFHRSRWLLNLDGSSKVELSPMLEMKTISVIGDS